MKKYILGLITITGLLATSCRKYVEVDPLSNSRIIKYTTDYQDLLNNTSVFEYSYLYPLYSSDDAGIDNATLQNSMLPQQYLTYQWADTRLGITDIDVDWERLYKQIYTCNLVTDGVMSSTGGTAVQKTAALAVAKVHRAYAYLTLVNLYAAPYNPATAATDLGLPLLTTSSLYTSLKRASVQDVYAQIIKDLTEALPDLPDLPVYNSDPSKAAAYALLAEASLYKRDFASAGSYADKVLALKNTLTDLNTYAAAPSTLPKKLADPETIFSKLVSGNSYSSITLSSDLLTLLGTSDLRYTLFTGNANPATYGKIYYRQNYTNEGVYIGPNVPEMMLIKAESAARAGDVSAAVNELNTLRKKRFKPADYVDLTATNAADALTLVINERRRELFGRGFRWFDMRRLNQDAAFAKTYTHTFKGTAYTLEPYSNRYTYAIGTYYITLNPEIVQNPR
ncbi:SusD family protein [Mucilaginibacter gossypiicola]|uniref:SusD family protein n=1 Tax=Mucilaginibacter gossypiicola TaxID=551995 RepID=A0A1H8LM05_9SPHI|nr:RagB/SusD family nutrient uptake outer membrane protein [Mucilaginibacter gossypiicola]SEO06242.1 SusD family protein [Mucilaginibacter gossypiicola]